MKKYIFGLPLTLAFLIFFSCEKDVLEDPIACFTCNSDTIKKNEYVTFYICGDAMYNTIFSGDFLSKFVGIDSINGQGNPVPLDSVIVKYTKVGEYQPWLVSTNSNYKGLKRTAVPLSHKIIVIN